MQVYTHLLDFGRSLPFMKFTVNLNLNNLIHSMINVALSYKIL